MRRTKKLFFRFFLLPEADDSRGGFVLRARSEPPSRRRSLSERSMAVKKTILQGLRITKQKSTGDINQRVTTSGTGETPSKCSARLFFVVESLSLRLFVSGLFFSACIQKKKNKNKTVSSFMVYFVCSCVSITVQKCI